MLCEYNCGSPWIHILSSGKKCCKSSYRMCQGYKDKMSSSCKKSYQDSLRLSGYDKYQSLPDYTKKAMSWSKGKILKSIDSIFCKNSSSSNGLIKRAIVENNLFENKCSICNISTWLNSPLTLELDHINGDSTDNQLSNLRLLCPNCHSQTPTFRGKNINHGIKKVSDEDLIKSISTSKNTREALLSVGLSPKGGNYSRVSRLIESNQASFKKK